MKKSILALAVLATLSFNAHSAPLSEITNNTPVANSSAIAGASAGASSSTIVGVGVANSVKNDVDMGQGQSQETINSNNTKTTVKVDGDTYKAPDIPVSSAVVGALVPSSQCMGVVNGAVQGMSIGIAMGKSYESKPCNQRELARMFAQLGMNEAATSILCSMEYAEVVAECKGKTVQALKETSKTVASSNGYYSTVSNPLGK